MKILRIAFIAYFAVGLIGCSDPVKQHEPLSAEEIESTIERCIEKKWLTRAVKQNEVIVQISCEPEGMIIKKR
ncbi:hypothetical protein KAR91_21590 [Candidatus Pacearchaeota archaeon]|nr:hypothetical protein [Candidatus Pacearchaeota archaeon]